MLQIFSRVNLTFLLPDHSHPLPSFLIDFHMKSKDRWVITHEFVILAFFNCLAMLVWMPKLPCHCHLMWFSIFFFCTLQGIVIKTPVQWPLSKGFSFSCWLRIENFPRSGTMGLFSFLTEKGRGGLAVLARDKVIYEVKDTCFFLGVSSGA